MTQQRVLLMAKKNTKYDTELEKTVFSWGIISTDVTIANLMRKKARGGFDQRYVVLSHIMYYKPATKEGTPHKYDLPRGVINLRRVQYNDVRIDADNSSLIVPTSKRVFEFKSPEDKVLSKWLRVVTERSKVIQEVQTEELVNFNQDIKTVQALFPKNFCVTPRINIECIDKIIEDKNKCTADLKKWDPFMRKASLFLECYFGQNRNYVDWFVGSDGPSRIMQSVEEDMLAQWKSTIEKALKAAPEIATIRFFKEDMEETAQLCDQAVVSIEGINQYSKIFLNSVNYVDQYTREKEVLQRFATSFRAFPSLRAVDFRTHKGGTVRGSNGDEFSFSVLGGVVSITGKYADTKLQFTAQGPELVSQNEQHGTVVWNTRTWVWFHPRYPHTIRFDYDVKSGIFRFRPSPSAIVGKNSALGGKGEGVYADWKWDSGQLVNMGGEGKKAPLVCGSWKVVDGDVPVAAVLLAGMAEIIVNNSKSA